MISLVLAMTGNFRIPFLIMDWILVILIFELSILFLIRHQKQSKESKNHKYLAFFFLMLGLSILNFLIFIENYYLEENQSTSFLYWINIGYKTLFQGFSTIFIMIGSILFFLMMELDQKLFISKYFFTFVSISLFSIYILLSMFFIELLFPISTLFSLIFLFLFIISIFSFSNYLNVFIFNISLMKGILAISLFLMLLGSVISEDFIIDTYGYHLKLIGILLKYISFSFIIYFALILPPLQEMGWKEHIEDIFLVNSYGACIFSKSYNSKNHTPEKHIISGAITSINMMLSKLSNSERRGISIIKKKGKITYIYVSDKLVGVLFGTQEFSTIKINLERFVKRVETTYDKILDTWDGTLDIFLPIEEIAAEFF
jgi:hypothetical protein